MAACLPGTIGFVTGMGHILDNIIAIARGLQLPGMPQAYKALSSTPLVKLITLRQLNNNAPKHNHSVATVDQGSFTNFCCHKSSDVYSIRGVLQSNWLSCTKFGSGSGSMPGSGSRSGSGRAVFHRFGSGFGSVQLQVCKEPGPSNYT